MVLRHPQSERAKDLSAGGEGGKKKKAGSQFKSSQEASDPKPDGT